MTVWSVCGLRDELDLLEIRLGTLDDVVDVHVVSEAPFTHAGQPKPLHLKDNWRRFKPWHHKLRYVVYGEDPGSVWGRERQQRAVLSYHIEPAPDDLVMVSDCDEIPDPAHWQQAEQLARAGGIAVPRLDVYCMGFRWRWPETWPGGLRVVTGATLADSFGGSVQALFETYNQDVGRLWEADTSSVYGPAAPPSLGWHFSFFGGVAGAQAKMAAVAHTDYNVAPYNTAEWLEECLETGRDVFDRAERQQVRAPKRRLPPYVLSNWERFKHLW